MNCMKQICFAENLKNLRTSGGKYKHKLSQEAIAKATGIARSMISDYENGKKEPTLSALEAIANFFEITLDELVYGK